MQLSQTNRTALLPLLTELFARGADVRIRVTGASMRPFLCGGEILTLRRPEGGGLRRGDLVLFVDRDGRPVLHRIVHRRASSAGAVLRTLGDGLIGLDEALPEQRVLARVCAIERPGRRVRSLDTPGARGSGFLRAQRSLFRSWAGRIADRLVHSSSRRGRAIYAARDPIG